MNKKMLEGKYAPSGEVCKGSFYGAKPSIKLVNSSLDKNRPLIKPIASGFHIGFSSLPRVKTWGYNIAAPSSIF